MAGQGEGFPWYLKLLIALTLLVIAFIVVVDLLQFATSI